jgi:CHAD domain-containing protein
MTTTVHEIERKYEGDGALSVPPMDDLPGGVTAGEPSSVDLDATYFDTADLRLAARGVRLRRRTGGDDAGWHLKAPSGDGSVLETHAPLGQETQAVPPPLATLVDATTRGEPLRPALRVQTRRQQRPLVDADGRLLAYLVEDHVSAQSLVGDTAPVSWHEVEVELVQGDEGLLDAVEERLLAGGLRPSTAASKVERALGNGMPSVQKPGPVKIGRKVTSGEVLTAYLREQVSAIMTNDPRVRRDEPDSVHKMRVATRRLRSAFRSFRPLLDREATDPVSQELRWLAGELGTVRDLEVLRARLLRDIEALPGELVLGPVHARVSSKLTKQYAEAREELLAELSGARYFALLDALDALAAAPALSDRAARPARADLPRHVRRAYRRLRSELDAVPGPERRTERDTALHEARKSAKRLRYAAEAVTAVFGNDASRLATRAEALQELLGEHNDGVVLSGVLRQLAVEAYGAGENAFTYGLVAGQERCRAEATDERLPATIARLEAKKTVGWLG